MPAPAQILYFVEEQHRGVAFFPERETADMDRETVIRDLIAMQFEHPLRVLEVIPGEGTCRDVSEDVAREIAARVQREPISRALLEFVEAHCGLALGRELVEAA
jgi:hypothetical protein